MTRNFQQVPLALADVNKWTAPARCNKFCGSHSKISILKKNPKQSADTGVLQNKGLKNQDKEKKRKVWNYLHFSSSSSSEKADFQQTAVISNYDT